MSKNPLPKLTKRVSDGHKGDYGHALLVGGSRGMPGAIALAGMAALRSGAGLVTLAVPDVILDTVASFEPSMMTVPLASDAAGRIDGSAREQISALAAKTTCIGCGPGMGDSPQLVQLVSWMYESLTQPLIVDADALNALARRAGGLSGAAGARVITPHPGEFRRLVGQPDLSIDAARAVAVDVAAENGIIVVLKGNATQITDGQKTIKNTTGNPGMATGGSGDVLTGVLTALAGQGLSPLEAAHLGTYVHGLAGDMTAAELGQVSLIASDLVQWLPDAFRQLEA